jgi:predicted MFS family arabinose efflux permease
LTPETHPLRLALGGPVAMAAAIGIGRFVYAPILPLMVESLGLSNTAAGALASANFAGYLVGPAFAAALLVAAPLVWTLPQDSAHLHAPKPGS